MAQLAQVLALALAIVLAMAHRAGLIDPAGAFFGAIAIGATYTGHQFLSRLDLTWSAAAAAVLMRPDSRESPWTYWVYQATLAVLAATIVDISICLSAGLPLFGQSRQP